MINLQNLFYRLSFLFKKDHANEPAKQRLVNQTPSVTTYTPTEPASSMNEWANNIYKLNSKK